MWVVRGIAGMLAVLILSLPAYAEPEAGLGTPQSPAIINSKSGTPEVETHDVSGGAAPAAETNIPADDAEPATDSASRLAEPAVPEHADRTPDEGEKPPVKPSLGAYDLSPYVDKPASSSAGQSIPSPPPVEPTLFIDINLSTQRLTVTENGASKYTWPISSAAPGYRTPTGTFKPTWMSKMWYSRQYDLAPMPNSIFFSGGVAIHATQQIRQLGRPASHGCVRLAPSNAARLYAMVGQHGKEATKITVHGSPHYAPTVASYGARYGYGPMPRRRPSYYGYGGYYGYYDGPPSYYAPAPKRRYGYGVKPRRYVTRGMFNPYPY